MPTLAPQSEAVTPLADWLAENTPLGPDVLAELTRQLATQLVALHEQGRLHGALSLEQVVVAASGSFRLLVRSDGPSGDLRHLEGEACPPELHQFQPLDLPGDLPTAAEAIRAQGETVDPRRIDVYQLGALVTRVATGGDVEAYLCRPQAAASLPRDLRRVLDRALGFSAAQRLASCQELLSELAAPHEAEDTPRGTGETPSQGVSLPHSDTDVVRPERRSRSAGAQVAELPFTRLGQYEIVARLGSGGMGDVYQGYDADLDRYVAIKVLPAELARSSDFVARFRTEAAAAAKVEHPNIVPIYTIGSDQGHHFFAMQLVAGQSLAQLLAQQPRPPLETTLAIIEQVVSGLAAAHRHGLVHRDIKPGNILLTEGGRRALLADFGLVKTVADQSRMTATGVVMGTVDYISPEQGRGKLVDGRSDLYSIGVLLYQMLAGRLPFVADSPTAMIFQHAYEPAPSLALAAPDVSPGLATVVHRLLAKSPSDRHPTCDALLDDLRAIRAGRSPAQVDRQATAIIVAPKFGDEPPAPEIESPAAGWSRANLYQHAVHWLGRQAPEVVRHLQNTQQQVDGAVFEYQQRCQTLGRLVGEAEAVQQLLAEQIHSHQAAAAEAQQRIDDGTLDSESLEFATADRHSNQAAAAELEQQRVQQLDELESMQLALAKAKAKLSRLQGQRDALNARLQLAQARYGLADRRPRRRLPPRLAMLGVAAILLPIACLGVWTFVRQDGKPGASGIPAEQSAESTSSSATGSQSAVATPTQDGQKGLGSFFLVPAEIDAARQSAVLPVNSTTMIAAQDNDGILTLVVGAEDGTLIWCETREGKLQDGIPCRGRVAHAQPITAMAWNYRSRQLATAARDGEVFVWSDQATVTRKLPHGQEVRGLAISPDGSQLLTASRKGILCWDVASGSELERYTNKAAGFGGPSSLAWFPDGSAFVAGNIGAGGTQAGFVVPLDGKSWRPLQVAGGMPVWNLALFEGGNRAIGVTQNKGVSTWNTSDGSRLLTFDNDIMVMTAAYSAWGTRALTGHQDGSVALWDTVSGQKIQDVGQFSDGIRAVALSESGDAGAAVEGQTLHVFSLPPETVPGLRNRIRRKGRANSLAFSPTKFEAVVASLDEVEVYSLLGDGFSEQAGAAPASTAVFSLDGTRLLVARPTADREGYGPILLQDRASQGNSPTVRRYRGHQGGTSVALFARNGSRVVSGGNDNHLRVWETQSERELDSVDVGAAVRKMAITRDGRQAVVAGDQVDPDVWSLDTKQKLGQLTGHSLLVQAIAIARNANIAVTISGDNTARVWDLSNLSNIATFAHPGAVTAVDVSAEGTWIVTGSQDGALRFWDVKAKSPGPVMWAHQGPIAALALAHDNRTCASVGEDQFLCWWNVPDEVLK